MKRLYRTRKDAHGDAEKEQHYHTCLGDVRNGLLSKRHVTRKGTEHMPYQCGLCGKSFRRIQHLQKHAAQGPTNCRTTRWFASSALLSFPCALCEAVFQSHRDLRRHLAGQSHINDILYACHYCSAGFLMVDELNLHKAIVHDDPVHGYAFAVMQRRAGARRSGALKTRGAVEGACAVALSKQQFSVAGADGLKLTLKKMPIEEERAHQIIPEERPIDSMDTSDCEYEPASHTTADSGKGLSDIDEDGVAAAAALPMPTTSASEWVTEPALKTPRLSIVIGREPKVSENDLIKKPRLQLARGAVSGGPALGGLRLSSFANSSSLLRAPTLTPTTVAALHQPAFSLSRPQLPAFSFSRPHQSFGIKAPSLLQPSSSAAAGQPSLFSSGVGVLMSPHGQHSQILQRSMHGSLFSQKTLDLSGMASTHAPSSVPAMHSHFAAAAAAAVAAAAAASAKATAVPQAPQLKQASPCLVQPLSPVSAITSDLQMARHQLPHVFAKPRYVMEASPWVTSSVSTVAHISPALSSVPTGYHVPPAQTSGLSSVSGVHGDVPNVAQNHYWPEVKGPILACGTDGDLEHQLFKDALLADNDVIKACQKVPCPSQSKTVESNTIQLMEQSAGRYNAAAYQHGGAARIRSGSQGSWDSHDSGLDCSPIGDSHMISERSASGEPQCNADLSGCEQPRESAQAEGISFLRAQSLAHQGIDIEPPIGTGVSHTDGGSSGPCMQVQPAPVRPQWEDEAEIKTTCVRASVVEAVIGSGQYLCEGRDGENEGLQTVAATRDRHSDDSASYSDDYGCLELIQSTVDTSVPVLLLCVPLSLLRSDMSTRELGQPTSSMLSAVPKESHRIVSHNMSSNDTAMPQSATIDDGPRVNAKKDMHASAVRTPSMLSQVSAAASLQPGACPQSNMPSGALSHCDLPELDSQHCTQDCLTPESFHEEQNEGDIPAGCAKCATNVICECDLGAMSYVHKGRADVCSRTSCEAIVYSRCVEDSRFLIHLRKRTCAMLLRLFPHLQVSGDFSLHAKDVEELVESLVEAMREVSTGELSDALGECDDQRQSQRCVRSLPSERQLPASTSRNNARGDIERLQLSVCSLVQLVLPQLSWDMLQEDGLSTFCQLLDVIINAN